MNAKEFYKHLRQQPSDINEHLPVLRDMSSRCRTVIEFGFRTGVSTMALIMGSPEKLITYDIDINCNHTFEELKPYADEMGVQFCFTVEDTSKIICPKTDMLFIDTWHNAVQIKKELKLSGNQADKFLVFHDTVTFGLVGEKGGNGIMQPILDFVMSNPHWHIKQELRNNNGLMILERR